MTITNLLGNLLWHLLRDLNWHLSTSLLGDIMALLHRFLDRHLMALFMIAIARAPFFVALLVTGRTFLSVFSPVCWFAYLFICSHTLRLVFCLVLCLVAGGAGLLISGGALWLVGCLISGLVHSLIHCPAFWSIAMVCIRGW